MSILILTQSIKIRFHIQVVGEIGPDHTRMKTKGEKIVFDAKLFRE